MFDMLRRCRPLLGTFVSIEADTDAAAIERAFSLVEHVHARMSFHSGTSDLARLRKAPWGTRVEVALETVQVLRCAALLHAETDGLFDVTIARRLVAAGFLPRPDGIDLRQITGKARDIEIDGDAHVRCHRPLLVDLGGVAKGHAVDLAIASLIAGGASRGLVDAGGDMRLFGPAPRTIGIRNGDGQVRHTFQAQDTAIATSSNRYTRRRHRCRDVSPHFGAGHVPILALESVTVVAGSCMIADAFTKVVLADPAVANRLLPHYGGMLIELPSLARAA